MPQNHSFIECIISWFISFQFKSAGRCKCNKAEMWGLCIESSHKGSHVPLCCIRTGWKVAFFVTVFIRVTKTGSTQSHNISSPPYVNLNPESSIMSAQCQLKRTAVRTCGSNNMPLLSSWLQKIPPIDIHCVWTECMGESCVDVSTVRCWIWQFKQEEVGEASMCDIARLERPLTATGQK
jgi:hypothetical protein